MVVPSSATPMPLPATSPWQKASLSPTRTCKIPDSSRAGEPGRRPWSYPAAASSPPVPRAPDRCGEAGCHRWRSRVSSTFDIASASDPASVSRSDMSTSRKFPTPSSVRLLIAWIAPSGCRAAQRGRRRQRLEPGCVVGGLKCAPSRAIGHQFDRPRQARPTSFVYRHLGTVASTGPWHDAFGRIRRPGEGTATGFGVQELKDMRQRQQAVRLAEAAKRCIMPLIRVMLSGGDASFPSHVSGRLKVQASAHRRPARSLASPSSDGVQRVRRNRRH